MLLFDDDVDKRLHNIKHADKDVKQYRGLVLKNKMKILLISDPSTDISTAAMSVNIGYGHDPDDLPGLAHLCEHMLHIRTETHSEQDDYDKYLSQYGGKSNAETRLKSTTYYFHIIPRNLEGALDRFAKLFIAPLFREELIEKEINIIHSEYNEYLPNDARRLMALHKLSIKPDHPYSKFSTGNKETLSKIPKEKNINVRSRLLEFHEIYYSANIMSLCILGQESLDALENMVVKRFRNVINKEVVLPMYPGCPFKDEDLNTMWEFVPKLDYRMLCISFSLPGEQREHHMPLKYIRHLLIHKSEGLLPALMARDWCSNVDAQDCSLDTSVHFFTVVFYLTDEGMEHKEDIVQIMFGYINMLKKNGPIKWIYKELQYMENTNNKYKNRLSTGDISDIARLLHECPMENIFSKKSAWRPALIEELMGRYFTPQNIRIYVAAKEYESETNETEKWYGVKYKKKKISEKHMKMWNRADPRMWTDIKLLPKNEFIPIKFDIKTEHQELNVKQMKQVKEVLLFPNIVKDTSFVRVWYKKDDVFRVPQATMIFHFVSPFAYMNPHSSNLTDTFVELLHESLNEYTYMANLAGLKLEITATIYGIKLVIDGYNDKQKVLLERSIKKMINYTIDPMGYGNWTTKRKDFNDIRCNTRDYLKMLLTEQHWSNDALLSFTGDKHIDADRFELFIQKLFSKMHVEGLIYGNVTKKEARNISELIHSMLTTKKPPIVPLLQKQLVLYREIKLEVGCRVLFEDENKVQNTSQTIVYYATGLRSTESNMLLLLLNQIIMQPCIKTLRTTENLGYTVFSKITMMNGTQYLTVAVRGSRCPKDVEERIDVFMDFMSQQLSAMSEEQFNNNKESLISLRLKAPDTISSQCSLYWEEIESQEYNFDRVNTEVSYLKNITKEELLIFFKVNIYDKLTRRKLSVHVLPTAMSEKRKESDKNYRPGRITVTTSNNKTNKIETFDDLLSFKLSQSLYPLLELHKKKEFVRKGKECSKSPLLEPIDENVVRKGIKCF